MWFLVLHVVPSVIKSVENKINKKSHKNRWKKWKMDKKHKIHGIQMKYCDILWYYRIFSIKIHKLFEIKNKKFNSVNFLKKKFIRMVDSNKKTFNEHPPLQKRRKGNEFHGKIIICIECAILSSYINFQPFYMCCTVQVHISLSFVTWNIIAAVKRAMSFFANWLFI